MEKLNKVFLGGTCNDSTWRDELIPMLQIPYFNPVVKDWTPECRAKEIEEKKMSRWQLYVLTPKMTGIFSVAEVVDASNKDPRGTLCCILYEDGDIKFTEGQARSLEALTKLLASNGVVVCNQLDEIALVLNASKIGCDENTYIYKFKDNVTLETFKELNADVSNQFCMTVLMEHTMAPQIKVKYGDTVLFDVRITREQLADLGHIGENIFEWPINKFATTEYFTYSGDDAKEFFNVLHERKLIQ